MVSFELGKEIEKDVFCPVTSVGKRKNSESGMRNRTSNLRIPRLDALPLSHEDSTVSDIYYEVHMTSITKFIFENPTYIQWKAMKQLEHSPRKKDSFNVYTFKGLQFIFYKDEFKVWLKIWGEMCLPLVA